VGGLGGLSYGIWSRFLPQHGSGNLWLNKVIIEFVVPGLQLGDDPAVLQRNETILYVLLGLAMLATLPFITHGLVRIHQGIARGMLGRFASDELKREVAALGASRDAAVSAEDHSLRRLERDIHDGPQQRLVRLRMDLAAAERALETDPERARTLIAEASEHAHDTLEELRALSRGFAPPILLDRGLVAALEALASRATVPVALDVHLPEKLVLPTEVERNVYFTVSELLTNVAKHSEATRADVTLVLMRDFDETRVLVARVNDDGRGGASVQEGHGLQGLVGRIGALDGDVSISSPQGGPTRITARVPLLTLNGVPTDGSGTGAGGSPAASPDPTA
jgi:signal transduction histidine kinase